MIPLLSALFILLAFLIVEKVAHERRVRRIPLRIAVTGTRGKSSLVRMIASILKEDGSRVLAKTTGTLPLIVEPDGNEHVLTRRGKPTIIEQMGLVRRAAGIQADVLIAEIMSIQPENHRVEARQLIKPQFIVITNVRQDHTDAMGETLDEIASVFAETITAGSVVFIPEKETRKPIVMKAQQRGATIFRVSAEKEIPQRGAVFEDQVRLATAVAEHLKLSDSAIGRGLSRALEVHRPLEMWEITLEEAGKTVTCVNGFSANDPESTFDVGERAKRSLRNPQGEWIGIFNLRRDRGDRTIQWVHALRARRFPAFREIFITGPQAAAARRMLKRGTVLPNASGERMMEKMLPGIADGAVLFGFGNWKGAGQTLCEYWRGEGRAYGT